MARKTASRKSASKNGRKRSTKGTSRATAKKRTTPRRKASATASRTSSRRRRRLANTLVTVRHYCQGIGDCHLLRFRKADGGDFWMLIDCGVHSSVAGGSQKIAAIVHDIAKQTNKRLDVLVVTHEHWDHVSGFLTEQEQFKTFSIGEVWMAWTEDPKDRQARELDKFKQQALATLQMASKAFDRAEQLSPFLVQLHKSLDALLGFSFGLKGEKVRSARDAAAHLAPGGPRYFEPESEPITIPELPDLRIYVLGPPRDEKLLGITEKVDEMYGFGGPSGWPISLALNNALQLQQDESASDDVWAPFDVHIGAPLSLLVATIVDSAELHELDKHLVDFVDEHYVGPVKTSKTSRKEDKGTDQSWRRIDMDWLGISADLALQLDDRTNNTSLALAFEFKDSQKVMLFAADAQIGNWMSWNKLSWSVDGKSVTSHELLTRTVFYKVGHHGSHNATAKSGLELMVSPDLSAFIPTNEVDAKKVRWDQMPFPGILDRLEELCSGRVIRSDDPWVAAAKPTPGFTPPSGSIRDLRHGPGLYVELDLG
jgi:hypothetical protein